MFSSKYYDLNIHFVCIAAWKMKNHAQLAILRSPDAFDYPSTPTSLPSPPPLRSVDFNWSDLYRLFYLLKFLVDVHITATAWLVGWLIGLMRLVDDALFRTNILCTSFKPIRFYCQQMIFIICFPFFWKKKISSFFAQFNTKASYDTSFDVRLSRTPNAFKCLWVPK